MKEINVYLFKAPDCIRGWLSYLENKDRFTLLVSVQAENGSKAKNKAITLANKGFPAQEIKVLEVNYEDPLWGVNNFPELKEVLAKMYCR